MGQIRPVVVPARHSVRSLWCSAFADGGRSRDLPLTLFDDAHSVNFGYRLRSMKATLARLARFAFIGLPVCLTQFDLATVSASDTTNMAARGIVTHSHPTLFLIGDSTVNTPTKGQMGWGKPIAAMFDTNRIAVLNKARGGRSSRTYFTEGLWEEVRKELKPGDFLLMQFGHNDGGSLSDGRARASIKGNGNETQEIENKSTGKKET